MSKKKIRPFWEAHENPNGMDSHLYEVPSDTTPNSPLITPPPIRHYFLGGGGRRGSILFHGCISADPRRVADLVSLFKASTTQDTLPGVYSFAFQSPLFRMGGSSGSAVKIDLVGSDLEDVSQSALALFGTLVQEYGSFAVRPDPVNFNVQAPELQIIPDLDRMTDLNLTVEDLGLTIQANSDGALIGDYDLGGDIIDLKLISKDAINQTTITNFGDAKMTTSDGVILNLDTISDFKWRRAPEQIKRVDRQRAVTLEFTPPVGMPLQKAINGINQKVAELKKANAILPGVEIQLAGAASKLTEVKEALLGDGSTVGMLSSALFLAVMIVYLLMCILFQSWIYPFVIMFSVPLATFGGFLGLSLVHYWSEVDRYMPVQNMDVLTIIGFVILAGVVVNNAILIVAQTLNFLRYDKKLEPRKAISMAVESRVRPIFMSMSTSVGGMLPLVLMPGSGSELYRGLGAVVVGGLFISTIFTLILIPILLGLMFDLKDKLRSVTRFQQVTGVLLLMFVFSGCAVGKNYIQPRTMVSEDWQTGLERGLVSKPSDLKQWWTSFEDTQLNELIREAVDGNYDIKVAVARIKEARARRGIAIADLFPSIDALGSYSKTRNSETTDTGIKNVSFNKRQTIPMEIYSTGFDSAWELDIFGGVRRSIEAASAEVDEIHAELHDIMVTLLSELAVNYIELRNTQNRLGIAKANVKTQEETFKLTKARFDSGLTDELDTAQAETNLENTRSQIPVLEEQLNHALNRIAVLTGKQPGALNIQLTGIGSIPVPPEEVAIGLPAALLRRRPDIRMAERALAAETARIGVAESDLYPKFFLKNSFGFSASNGGDVFKPGSQTYGVGPSVTWRIFSSGQIRNNIKAQNEREKQALYRFHNTVLSALEEVESAVISYSREMNRRDTLQKTVKAAEKTVKLAKIQYTNGLTDFNNLLLAERSLFTAQDQLSISEARVSKNLISLYKALGGGWDLDSQGGSA
ncbi:MAG: multicomponent efflux pump (outer membrane subunit, RND family of ABC transporters) [Candidatus Scalindua brodae]|uniref:Multicomponent efflux pump (Outer membrane subunit, RND family of ABC transporters) n=1 Tax=Candidatus Scalindua brodae TaxID=237368 RepID=A0A0B0EKE2_9BACT|nr:MAG: multicomponent efflux pump (outer membrane subunit, RND family of ABC transporters) [Candidatus Scalindua brodae]